MCAICGSRIYLLVTAVTSLVLRSFEFIIEGEICEARDFTRQIHSQAVLHTAVH